jgi:hypothetical protein
MTWAKSTKPSKFQRRMISGGIKENVNRGGAVGNIGILMDPIESAGPSHHTLNLTCESIKSGGCIATDQPHRKTNRRTCDMSNQSFSFLQRGIDTDGTCMFVPMVDEKADPMVLRDCFVLNRLFVDQ